MKVGNVYKSCVHSDMTLISDEGSYYTFKLKDGMIYSVSKHCNTIRHLYRKFR